MRIDGVEISNYGQMKGYEAVIKDIERLLKKYRKLANDDSLRKDEVVYYKDGEYRNEYDTSGAYGWGLISGKRRELINQELEDIKKYNQHFNEDTKFAARLVSDIKSSLEDDLRKCRKREGL